jgi:nuclear GTP-binding protein
LELLARKMGKLLKKGEPDLNAVARIVLNDLQRGKLPYYVAPKDFEIPLPTEQEPSEEPVPEENKDVEKAAPEGTDAENSEKSEGKENSQKPPLTSIKVDQDFSKIKMAIEFDNPQDENPETEPEPKIDIDQVLNPEDMPDLEVAASDNESSDDDDADAESKNKAITASGKFTVSAKRKLEEAEAKNLTAKDRRAIERAQKRKKIGSNFYEVTNVKNRNREKAKPPADIVKKRK